MGRVLCSHVIHKEFGLQTSHNQFVHGNIFAIKLYTAYLRRRRRRQKRRRRRRRKRRKSGEGWYIQYERTLHTRD